LWPSGVPILVAGLSIQVLGIKLDMAEPATNVEQKNRRTAVAGWISRPEWPSGGRLRCWRNGMQHVGINGSMASRQRCERSIKWMI
jgi:hypothetical protein